VSAMMALALLWHETQSVGMDWTLCAPMPGFRMLSQFCSGYFLFDLYMSLRGWGAAYVLHAALSFVTYIIPVFSDYCHRYACGFLLFEVLAVTLVESSAHSLESASDSPIALTTMGSRQPVHTSN
jgi:hypothetical protein